MATILQGVAAFGHFAPPVVVYAKQPEQARGRALMCFPSEYTTYVFCVNCGGRKWDIVKRFRDFMQFEAKLMASFPEEHLAGREPIPEKNFFLSNSPSFIEHRRWRLEMFINSLAHCPAVAHSDMFKIFLEYSADDYNNPQQDDAFQGLNAYDREQEALKMQKLSDLARMPTRAARDLSNGLSPGSANQPPSDQWAWAGDALDASSRD
mmetsp:Transcript_65068/g.155224  ORF Transcript_65068/g.155224 Transcript_65068/m.155224 type:complete len:208 (+) Transcript_65068:107-730(+)